MLKRREKTKSFNRRIIITISLANLAFWLFACVVAAFVMYEEYEEAFDGALRLSATRLLPMAINEWKQGARGEGDAPAHREEYSTYQLLDSEGRVLMRSYNAPHEPYGVALRTGYARNREWRIYSLASPDGAFFMQVADRMSERREAIWEAMAALSVPALIFIPLMMLGMTTLLRRQLRPIQHLSELIGEKDSGNMQPIDGAGLQREFWPIIASINHLLARLKAALEAERSFTANSAHEIRTPIAGALAHTQLLRAELPKRYQPRAGEVESGLQRLRHLSEKLLQLARADAHIGQAEHEVDLLPFIKAVVEDFKRIGMEERLQIECKTDALFRQINGDAFGIIVRNLLENALAYSFENSPVRIVISADCLTISNDCDMLDLAEIAQLGKRFYRGTQDGRGAGLGLSIVETLLQSMPASITYTSPLEGQARGFCATITF